jgi:hypothetical protein
MANNRITYATAQLALKDNRVDATTHVMGEDTARKPTTLASGISAVTPDVGLSKAGASGIWPAAGTIGIQSAGGTVEYLRYSGWIDATHPDNITRGIAGTTSGVHASGDTAVLAGWEPVMGVQSVSIGTTFNLEDVFHLGQIDPYENVEGIPEVEVNIERVLDGTKPLFLTCTDPDFVTLKGRTADYRVDAAVSIFPDTQDSATGTADSTCVASGCYLSSWGVSLVTDGNFTETATLVANDKQWGTASPSVAAAEGNPSGSFPTSDAYDANVIGSGVQRSEDYDAAGSTLPGELSGLSDKIQSIEVSVDLTREEIFELGSKTPFFRAISFPVTVTTTYTLISDKGDLINALGDGRTNLTNRSIVVATLAGLSINLGTKNKVNNVTFEGYDAGGGNGTITVEYQNSNALTVTHTGFPFWYSTNL